MSLMPVATQHFPLLDIVVQQLAEFP